MIVRAAGGAGGQGQDSRSSDDVRLQRALSAAVGAVRDVRHASRAHATLSQALAALGRREEALAELAAAGKLPPGHAEDHEALAFAAYGLGAHQLSRDYYAHVVELAPRDATAWYNLATSERNIGQLAAALACCERAISLDPSLFQVQLLRSQLSPQTTASNHISEIEQFLHTHSESYAAQVFLNYALGKELDDIGRFDDAFVRFSRGAATRRQSLQYDVRSDVEKLKRITDVFGKVAIAQNFRDGGREYAFILGLPRSGTTMIERVLTGHPKIRSNGETDNFVQSLLRATPTDGGDIFERAASADLGRVATGYAERSGAAPPGGLVLEKLPLNYLYAGLIHMAMPEAKIILVQRHAIDNCFSMYSTLFGAGYPFSYDLMEVAEYYIAYKRLTEHWKAVLPGVLLEIRYEDFVGDPSGSGSALAAHLGVDWSRSMLKIEDNPNASATASAAQVRRPIYTTSAGRWRNYAEHLQPLATALGLESHL